jgi:hypothetical protein
MILPPHTDDEYKASIECATYLAEAEEGTVVCCRKDDAHNACMNAEAC